PLVVTVSSRRVPSDFFVVNGTAPPDIYTLSLHDALPIFGLSPEHTAIWFGIIVLIVVEVGLITPPFGMNVFVINSLAPDVPMAESFRGVIPFLISDFIRVGILVAFPVLTLGVLRLLE